MAVTKRELGEILLDADLINSSQLDEALGLQKKSGERLASLLVRKRILTEKFAVTYLGRQVGFPGIDLSQTDIDLSTLDLVPLAQCERDSVFPIRRDGDRLLLAMIDPSDAKLVSRIEGIAKVRLAPMVALESSIKHAIREARKALKAGQRSISPNVQDADAESPRATGSPAAGRRSQTGTETAAAPGPDRPQSDPIGAATALAVASVAPKATPAPLTAPRPIPTTTKPLTILIASAEGAERARTESILAGQRHCVLTASAGKEALEVAHERMPDLVLLDAALPGMDGLDVCRQLRQSDRLRHVPVILSAPSGLGWRFAADVREGCGADDVVERPFDQADLLRRIDLLTDRTAPGLAQQKEAAVHQHLKDGVVALKQGRHEEAVAALRGGLEVDPFNDLLHYYLGMAHEKQEQCFSAIDHYERAVQVNPEFYDAIVSLANLYQRLKFQRKALEMWELALAATRENGVRERIKTHILELL